MRLSLFLNSSSFQACLYFWCWGCVDINIVILATGAKGIFLDMNLRDLYHYHFKGTSYAIWQGSPSVGWRFCKTQYRSVPSIYIKRYVSEWVSPWGVLFCLSQGTHIQHFDMRGGTNIFRLMGGWTFLTHLIQIEISFLCLKKNPYGPD